MGRSHLDGCRFGRLGLGAAEDAEAELAGEAAVVAGDAGAAGDAGLAAGLAGAPPSVTSPSSASDSFPRRRWTMACGRSHRTSRTFVPPATRSSSGPTGTADVQAISELL